MQPSLEIARHAFVALYLASVMACGHDDAAYVPGSSSHRSHGHAREGRDERQGTEKSFYHAGKVLGQDDDTFSDQQGEGLLMTVHNDLHKGSEGLRGPSDDDPPAIEAQVAAQWSHASPPPWRDYRLKLEGSIGYGRSRSFWLSNPRLQALLEQGDGRIFFYVDREGSLHNGGDVATYPIRIEPPQSGSRRHLDVHIRRHQTLQGGAVVTWR